jgi:23S rRNA (cytosine1962-C5)-methyltransferase
MILKLEKQNEYELLDSGLGQKLERYGPYTLSRPDPEALWNRSLGAQGWDDADLKFIRKGTKTQWIIKEGVKKNWPIEFGGLNFSIKPTSFKHTGLFPEQFLNWQWMEEVIKNEGRTVKVLNLFAYTGGATLAAARAGAEVCHVDGSKTAVAWARENAELSGLSDKPIRWIVEDVVLFLKREIKRGNKYDAIIMDPPSFGHGPKDELWKIEESFLELMKLCKDILSDDPLFVLINGYTVGYSPITYQNNLIEMMSEHKGNIEVGELTIKESNTQRLLPCGIFARWQKS